MARHAGQAQSLDSSTSAHLQRGVGRLSSQAGRCKGRWGAPRGESGGNAGWASNVSSSIDEEDTGDQMGHRGDSKEGVKGTRPGRADRYGGQGPFRKPETSLLEQGEAATLPWAAGTGAQLYIHHKE